MKYNRINLIRILFSVLTLIAGYSLAQTPAQQTQEDTDQKTKNDDHHLRGEDNVNNDIETYEPTIDPANFVTEIDNPYFPLKPGTVRIYEGRTDKGFEHVEVTVTFDTRQIMGVTCVVVRDVVTVDGKVAEDTYDWYAQDKDGNVWYFGEDTRAYEEDGTVSTEGSFEAGVDGAMPGIIMKGNPQTGEAYREEYYQGHAEDEAKILSISEAVTGPYGSFSNVLMTKNTTRLEPDLLENKYYAKGIGSVLEVDVAGGSGKIELIEIKN